MNCQLLLKVYAYNVHGQVEVCISFGLAGVLDRKVDHIMIFKLCYETGRFNLIFVILEAYDTILFVKIQHSFLFLTCI